MTNILTRDARAGLLAGRERGVRPGLVLAVVLIGQFMAVLDASIVNVAAPSIHASLHASGASLQLVVAEPPTAGKCACVRGSTGERWISGWVDGVREAELTL